MFAVSRQSTGPLTLEELQIHLPDKLDKFLNNESRACFFREVARRAKEAGDPTTLDPDAFPYWQGKVDQTQWNQHTRYTQRVLLAQAIVSWGMMDC